MPLLPRYRPILQGPEKRRLSDNLREIERCSDASNSALDERFSDIEKKISSALSLVNFYVVKYYTSNYSSFTSLIALIGSTSATVYVNTAITITANLTIPSNIVLMALRGGTINVASGVTLTISSSFNPQGYYIFTGTGTVVLTDTKYSRPEWWDDGTGATATTTAINSALAAYPTTKLSSKEYAVNGAISIPTGGKLFGDNKHKAKLAAATVAAGASYSMVSASNKNNVTVSGIGFDGGSGNYPDDTTTIPKSGNYPSDTLTFPTISGFVAELSTSGGTDADGANIRIEGCHFENMTNFGVRFTRPTGSDTWKGVHIINNTFYKGSYQERVISVTGRDNSGDLFGRDVVVSGNVTRRSSVSKYLKLGISGLNSSTDGIEINKCRAFVCTGNAVDRCAGTGIRIEACDGGAVVGNATLDTGQDGILIYNSTKDVTVSGNNVRRWGKIPNFGNLRKYDTDPGAGVTYVNYIARENPGPYNGGSPTVLFPADPSASLWFEENPYYLQGVSETTIPVYDTNNYYREAVAYSGDITANPPTGFSTANTQGVLAFRGYAGIAVQQLSERIVITGNTITGDKTQTGGKYNYASDYCISTVHSSNEPQNYNSPIILGPNIMSGWIKAAVYQPSFVDPINRQGAIDGIRLFPLQFTLKTASSTNTDELTELTPSLQENLLHAETIPSLTFATGGYVKVHGNSRPAIGTGAFGLLMFVRFTTALDTTYRRIFDAGLGGGANAGYRVLVRSTEINFSLSDGVDNYQLSYTTIQDWGAGDNKVLILYVCRESSGGALRMLVNGHEVTNASMSAANKTAIAAVNLDNGYALGIGADSNGTSSDIPFELFKLVMWGQSFTRDEVFTRVYEKRLIRNGDTVKLDLDLKPYGQFFIDKANFWADRYAATRVIYSTAANITASESRNEAFAADVTATNGSVWLTSVDQKCLPDDFFITHAFVEIASGTPTISAGSTAAATDLISSTVMAVGRHIFPINKKSTGGKISLTSSTTDSIKWHFAGFRAPGHTVGGTVVIGGGPRVLATNTTAVGNILTGEDDLMTYSVPASTLATNGDSLSITAGGTFAIATVRLRAYFGSDLLFDTGALVVGAAADWGLECDIIRTGATTQKALVRLNTSFASFAAYCDYTTPGRTLSSANTFKLTGEAALTNDISQEIMKIRFEPAA